MKIILEQIGRRFNRDWIFKNLNYTFESGKSYAILGANGSGKSTLLQVISGSLTSSEGKLNYTKKGVQIDIENVFPELSIAAPYLDLIEEFSLNEHIDFHFQFKNYRDGYDKRTLIALLNLLHSEHKALKNFSSGMKQRVKLALAFCSDTKVLLLDEPTSNLDQQGIEWYLSLIKQFSNDRLVIVCSNQEHEYAFCNEKLSVEDYK
ncbi:MAG: ATP-binding cassette domain-containing protein [Daejeonella sp.]|uniref:ABC transporter ATP-binding protein n=1 Tax=Daejeonella sp. TaxID=2805397 RepID=UPI003C785CF5